MQLLFSNRPPIQREGEDFENAFMSNLSSSDEVHIASGYISTASVTELQRIIALNKKPRLKLFVGMHYFDGITRVQDEALRNLSQFLKENKLGEVKISKPVKFHGKLFVFCKKGKAEKCIIGSSNLNNIVSSHRPLEADVMVSSSSLVEEAKAYIELLMQKAGMRYLDWKPESYLEKPNQLLKEHYGVDPAQEESKRLFKQASSVSFEIPLKSTPKSNLNAFFGRGRRTIRGLTLPRPWYEVELIVPKKITSQARYPKNIIKVVTDDGWRFHCKVSGQNDKNFRSQADLKILGKWIKGRLEEAGSLKPGQPVTDKVFKHYGRASIALMGTQDPNVWLLDFRVRQ